MTQKDKTSEEDFTRLEVMMDDLDKASEAVKVMYFPFAMLKLVGMVGEDEARKLMDAAVDFFRQADPDALRHSDTDAFDHEWPEEIG